MHKKYQRTDINIFVWLDGFLLLRYTFAEILRVETSATFPAIAKVNKVLVLGDLFAPESCELGLFTMGSRHTIVQSY